MLSYETDCGFSMNGKADGQFEEWCIADEQTPDEELQRALDWACGMGGADCSMILKNKPCYFPNTLRDHASYAFNDYYQKFKHKGATCYFNSAAMITDLDPSKIRSLIIDMAASQNLSGFDQEINYLFLFLSLLAGHNSCKYEVLP